MPTHRSNFEIHLRHERTLAEAALRRARDHSREARLAAVRLSPTRRDPLDLRSRDLAENPALRDAVEEIRRRSLREAKAAMALGEAEAALEERLPLHQ